MNNKVVTVSVALLVLWPFANPITADAKPITEAEKRHCEQAYHKYCGEYGLESNALRNCMSRNGRVATCVHRSSHRCWRGLAERGRASKKERQINSPLDTLAALLPCSRGGRHLGFLTSCNNWVEGTPLGLFAAEVGCRPFSHCRTDLLRRTSSILQRFCNEGLLVAYLSVM